MDAANKSARQDALAATGKPRLKLARIGHVIASSLAGSVLLAAGALTSALWLIGFPEFVPPKAGLSLERLLDLVKISFGVVAGVGAVVAVIVAYRRQKIDEAAAHRAEAAEARETTKLFNDRFSTASEKLGHEAPAVRLAAVHALAAIADDAPTRDLRQMVIDVLCAYLRMPYSPNPGQNGPQSERLTFAGLREVRHTIIRIISARLRNDASVPWQGHDFDFTGTVFDGGDFRNITVPSGKMLFDGTEFSAGIIDFSDSHFSGGSVSFEGALFGGATIYFNASNFSGAEVVFNKVELTAGQMDFGEVAVTGGKLGFHNSLFSGGTISFISATIKGGTVWFGTTRFNGSRTYMDVMRIKGGDLIFKWVSFLKGEISFESTEFAGGMTLFASPKFGGASVQLDKAKFEGGAVAIDSVEDYSRPPVLPGGSPLGLSLRLNAQMDRHTLSVMKKFDVIKQV
ncbi:pentapeptide repeat-containing protein [Nonomuraea angiospora]|uniref:pentapeptide repeat-containing protein n=1 Tax=Nonomuraea angiospora TaxID=46172 RepID=UPI0029A4055C|nr:pentapeptide repeat-containing protein [Nonomuraea angiospora]MDX3101626.1 pentapeptide repeat-containing protein [Nonomuraea angiospora]